MDGDANTQGAKPHGPGSAEELEQLLRLVPLGDMSRGLIFSSVVAIVRREVGDEAAQRCLTASGEKGFQTFFLYPFRSLMRLLYTAAWELSARHGGFESAMRRIGRGTVPDFLQSSVGRVLMSMGTLDARRLINGLTLSYSTILTHGAATLSWTSPRCGQLLISRSVLPSLYIEGSMLQLLEPFHLRELHVHVRPTGPMETTLDFSWA